MPFVIESRWVTYTTKSDIWPVWRQTYSRLCPGKLDVKYQIILLGDRRVC